MELNKIYNESNLETMAKMPDNFIDLTVTSPPYDNLREYKGYSFPFEDIAKELYRVTFKALCRLDIRVPSAEPITKVK